MEDYQRLNYYRLSAEEVLKELHSSPSGLKESEAKSRMLRLGPNRLAKAKTEPVAIIFIRQFKNLLVIMLLTSAALSIYLKSLKTAVILFAIALMNALVGFSQEHKAETLVSSLEKLLVTTAKVMRRHC
jgi:Ca2+-transporting ATPase